MGNILCSNNFREFFNNIESAQFSIDDLSVLVSSKLSAIAADISLGKLICNYNSPPSMLEENGRSVEFEFYSNPDGYNKNSVNFEYTTADNAHAVFSAFPILGYSWSNDEIDEVGFLCKNIFVLCGRARLSFIAERSILRDIFTGLPNAGGFIKIGNEYAKKGILHNFTAMFINLKNFKCVNSQVGDKSGDKIIKAYSTALIQKLDKGEVVARLGGDNFTFLINKENANNFIKFLSGVNVEIENRGITSVFCISARIGVYDILEGDQMTYVMNCISSAISNAKRSFVSDVVMFNPEIMHKVQKEQELAAHFPLAIKNKEFLVYYQPKVDLNTNLMCGCEALVRWNKNGKLIPPGEFIPVFERDGNVCALDFYMLDKVCADVRKWLDEGLEPVTVSVNFSKTHLHNPHVSDDILKIINKYGVDNKYIEIELTEMSDYNDYDAFKKLVTNMKNNGVVTSIDDFGTGYSSLNLLTDFNFDVVKLDKSFLDNIIKSNSKTDEIVVRNIVRMVKELNMKAIAEGVETPEQARFLKEIDCTMVQGYLYDKPLCAEEFEKRLKKKEYVKVL